MSTTKTKFGDSVQRFPGTDALRDAVAELREQLGELFDEASAEADRQARMAKIKPDTTGRNWSVLDSQ